ncbi:MAG: hypothetical protein SGJ21_06785 [Alphaproteobacteria bacterium]|nr:hypothetical protein [Alphaproteobacteria bacterium]
MKRAQRRLHAWTWTLLAVVILGLSLGALVTREHAEAARRAWAVKAGPL